MTVVVHDRAAVHGEVSVVHLANDVVAERKIRMTDQSFARTGARLHANPRTHVVSHVRPEQDEVEGYYEIVIGE